MWLSSVVLGPLGTNRFCAGLLAHPHAAADVGPGRARVPGPVHEVADQVVGQLAEVVGEQDGVAQLLQRVAVGVALADGVDEVVQSRCVSHASTIG
nr:hypothetical protein GCM10020241_55870 [Streptoalloteichus tenebrarius]